jgi:hypothetical protein
MKTQKGQTLVETSLILPILLMLLFDTDYLGRILHVYLTLDYAGREAAWEASVGSEDAVINLKIRDATSGLDEDILGISSENGLSNAAIHISSNLYCHVRSDDYLFDTERSVKKQYMQKHSKLDFRVLFCIYREFYSVRMLELGNLNILQGEWT